MWALLLGVSLCAPRPPSHRPRHRSDTLARPWCRRMSTYQLTYAPMLFGQAQHCVRHGCTSCDLPCAARLTNAAVYPTRRRCIPRMRPRTVLHAMTLSQDIRLCSGRRTSILGPRTTVRLSSHWAPHACTAGNAYAGASHIHISPVTCRRADTRLHAAPGTAALLPRV